MNARSELKPSVSRTRGEVRRRRKGESVKTVKNETRRVLHRFSKEDKKGPILSLIATITSWLHVPMSLQTLFSLFVCVCVCLPICLYGWMGLEGRWLWYRLRIMLWQQLMLPVYLCGGITILKARLYGGTFSTMIAVGDLLRFATLRRKKVLHSQKGFYLATFNRLVLTSTLKYIELNYET